MIVTATADQVAHLPDGRIVIAKPGTDVIYQYEDGSGQELWSGAQHPADLVAVTEACQTCGGNPSAEDHMCSKSRVVPVLDIRQPGEHCDCSWENDVCHWCGIEWLGDGDYRCPDCDNAGHPLFDLKVECEPCSPPLCEGWQEVTHCSGDGFVTHAGLYVPGPLLPICTPPSGSHDYTRLTSAKALIVIFGQDAELWARTDPAWNPAWHFYRRTITLPTDAGPGGFAVIAERSET